MLRLASVFDLAQASGKDIWFDELLARGRDVVVLGLNFDEGHVELRVLRLDEVGHLEQTAHYATRVGDYWSGDNYGSRLVGDEGRTSFFAMTAAEPADVGQLDLRNQVASNCEDCDAWYGDARAFFVGERIFGLSDGALAEGRWVGGGVVETQRVTLPLPGVPE